MVKAQISLNGYDRNVLILFKFVWRQSRFAFFGALTSVGALFYFIIFLGGKNEIILKKGLSLFLLIVMVVPMFANVNVFASTVASGSCGDNLTWVLDNSGTLTISGNGDMYDYYDDPDNWINSPFMYDYNTFIKEIIIEDGVTYIGKNAFAYLTNLQSVTISNTVEIIGDYAFDNCEKLTYINIGNSVKSIGLGAFNNCIGLKSVNINDIASWCEVNIISHPLYYAKKLYLNGELVTDLVIPNGVKKN